MAQFIVELREILSKVVVVEADDAADAISAVEHAYETGEIIIEPDNKIDTDIGVLESSDYELDGSEERIDN